MPSTTKQMWVGSYDRKLEALFLQSAKALLEAPPTFNVCLSLEPVLQFSYDLEYRKLFCI